MIALAIMSSNRVIGENHQPIYKIDNDRERFAELTKGKVVVYGSHTLQTLPNKQPLAHRTNIILSHDHQLRVAGATTVGSIQELKFVLRDYEPDDVFLIGGAQLFSELIDQCTSAILTIVESEEPIHPNTTELFPQLDQRQNWVIGRTSSTHFYNGYRFVYQTYVNTAFRKGAKLTRRA